MRGDTAVRNSSGQEAPATPGKAEVTSFSAEIREFGDHMERRLDYLFYYFAALQILQGVMIVALVKLCP